MRTQNEQNTHTPGPWRASQGTGYVAIMAGPTIDKQLAMTMTCNAEGMANARLIAAAPDLLAALEACVAAGAVLQSGKRGGEVMGQVGLATDAARLAIAKARGEA